MISRLLSISIVSFWLVMTGLLLRAVWFPADSRLNKVNPGAVFRLIAARGEASHLDIYEDRKIVGKLNVTPVTPDNPADRSEVRIHLDGNLNLRGGVISARGLLMKGNLSLDHEGNLTAVDFKMSTKSPPMELLLKQDAPDQPPGVAFSMGGLKLLDTRQQSGVAGSNPEGEPFLAMLLGLVGISPAELEAVKQQAEAEAAATIVDARQGEFELPDGVHSGYILSVVKAGKTSFRLCVENTGQIVSIETPTSYRLLSDELNGSSK